MSDIVEYQGSAIATAAQVTSQVLRVQEIMASVMKKDVHYGVIPGTNKNTLYKPGAETLCAAFHIAPKYAVDETRFDDGVRYRVTCTGVHQGSGVVVAEGMGSCSSMEEKYKWCKTYSAKEFDATPTDRRRLQYGWNREKREEYEIKQVRMEVADIENTLLKMACKRAMIAMVLNALAVSDIFAQDIEDLSKKARDMMVDEETGEVAARPQPQSKSGSGSNGAGTGQEQEAKESPPAKEGMLKLIRAKAAAIEVTEERLLACHNLTTLDGITVAAGNVILKSLESGPDAYAK